MGPIKLKTLFTAVNLSIQIIRKNFDLKKLFSQKKWKIDENIGFIWIECKTHTIVWILFSLLNSIIFCRKHYKNKLNDQNIENLIQFIEFIELDLGEERAGVMLTVENDSKKWPLSPPYII